MFCEKAFELIKELHRSPDILPLFNVSIYYIYCIKIGQWHPLSTGKKSNLKGKICISGIIGCFLLLFLFYGMLTYANLS